MGYSGQIGKQWPGPPTVAEHVIGDGAMQACPGGHAVSKEHAVPAGTLTFTQAFSTLPQWTPEQNWVVPGPMQRQVPAQGCPHGIEPAGAQVGGRVVGVVGVVVVVVVVVEVLVVGGAKGAHSIFAGPGITVLAPNWSSVGTVGCAAFGHLSS